MGGFSGNGVASAVENGITFLVALVKYISMDRLSSISKLKKRCLRGEDLKIQIVQGNRKIMLQAKDKQV